MKVTTYYLEMNSPEELIKKTDARGLSIVEAKINEFKFNRFLYQLIGEQWKWVDKLSLSDEEWKAYVETPNLRTWVAYYLKQFRMHGKYLQLREYGYILVHWIMNLH